MITKRKRISVFNIVVGTVLALFCIILVSLFVYALYSSVKTLDDFIDDPVGLPKFDDMHFENYSAIFEYFLVKTGAKGPTYYIEDMFLFSCLYAGGCALAITLSTSLMAYACSMFKCKLSKFYCAVVLFTIVFPIIGSQPSELQIAKKLYLHNTYLGNYFLKFSFSNLYFFVIYEAFNAIPKDYREAAEVEGASYLTIMVRIILPMAKNVIGTVFLVQFVALWNDYTGPLLFLPKYPTLALGLMSFSYNTSGPVAGEPFKLGASIVVFIPLMIIFAVFQKQLMGNLSAGGIKG